MTTRDVSLSCQVVQVGRQKIFSLQVVITVSARWTSARFLQVESHNFGNYDMAWIH